MRKPFLIFNYLLLPKKIFLSLKPFYPGLPLLSPPFQDRGEDPEEPGPDPRPTNFSFGVSAAFDPARLVSYPRLPIYQRFISVSPQPRISFTV